MFIAHSLYDPQTKRKKKTSEVPEQQKKTKKSGRAKRVYDDDEDNDDKEEEEIKKPAKKIVKKEEKKEKKVKEEDKEDEKGSDENDDGDDDDDDQPSKSSKGRRRKEKIEIQELEIPKSIYEKLSEEQLEHLNKLNVNALKDKLRNNNCSVSNLTKEKLKLKIAYNVVNGVPEKCPKCFGGILKRSEDGSK